MNTPHTSHIDRQAARRTTRFSAPFALLLLCASHGAAQAQTTQPAKQQQQAAQPAAQQQAAQPAAPARDTPARKTEPPSGVISGRVLGEGGEPLAGAAVSIMPRTSVVLSSTRQTVLAEEDGSFRLTGVDAGAYLVTAAAPGYVNEADPLTGRVGGPYRPGDTIDVRMVRGGVITGRVLDQQGEPLVGVSVRAFRLRDLDGRTAYYNLEDKTDDRGVYRIYGLMPGAYVVMAGGRSQAFGGPYAGAFDADVPTFYPSATRDTATEVVVRSGQESSGIDIRHRDEPGRRVTGTVEVPATIPAAEGTVNVSLTYATAGLSVSNAFIPLGMDSRTFSLEGVGDGDYELSAMVNARGGMLGASPSQRVTVRGGDVTGIKIVLAPLASIAGKLSVEPLAEADKARPECKGLPATTPAQEVLVSARSDRADRPLPGARTYRASEAVPDADGSFTLNTLEAGRYHLGALPLDEGFYLRSVQLPAQPTPSAQRRAGAPAAKSTQGASAATPGDFLSLSSGQQLTGVGVRVAAGAAYLSGVAAGKQGGPQPVWTAQSRIYLVPADREHAEDLLRYAETTPSADGSFIFKNLAPGRYRLVARETGAEPAGSFVRPVFWDANARAQLRRDAEASGTPLELQPCQRTTDFSLRLQ